jgi:hypothetical protein
MLPLLSIPASEFQSWPSSASSIICGVVTPMTSNSSIIQLSRVFASLLRGVSVYPSSFFAVAGLLWKFDGPLISSVPHSLLPTPSSSNRSLLATVNDVAG